MFVGVTFQTTSGHSQRTNEDEIHSSQGQLEQVETTLHSKFNSFSIN